jgi:putative endonuclease
MNWLVYIVVCSDDSLYTGITTDIEQRLALHAGGKGAKYFRGRTPTRLVYLETGHTRSTATSREAGIKKMRRDAKLLLLTSSENEL